MSASFSVVLPFYNEADFLVETLKCWVSQSRPPEEIILVDNGATDGSARLAREFLREAGGGIRWRIIEEPRPGKIRALAAGCAQAVGTWIAFSDADTDYPTHYLELCGRIIAGSRSNVVAVMALPASGDPLRPAARWGRWSYVRLTRLSRKHAHTGGYGHVLRRDALLACGGYDEERWPYVLADHEIMHRLLRFGTSVYHRDLWCRTSGRRADRRRVRWTFFERCLYHATPARWQGWFFYRFLGPRFARRGLSIVNLREQPWSRRNPGA